MKFKAVSGIMLMLLFVSLLATYRAACQATRVCVDPPTSSGPLGYTFSIDVVLEDVTNLYAWSFKLFWNNSILECTTEVLHYPLNCNWEDPNNIKLGPGVEQDYNETDGRWFRSLSAFPLSEPHPVAFTGTMTLASLTFTVVDLGVTTLHLQESKLSDPDANPISHVAEDGSFEGKPPEHDVAVLLETPCHVVPGDSALLNATVLNAGLNDETDVELHLLIDGDLKDSMVTSFLQVGTSNTLSYLWTPTVEAVYNVTAYVLPVSNEEDTTNNMKLQAVLVSDVIEVPFHYQTIQEAVDAASPGDTILVSAGTYYEPLVIDKSVTITGEEDRSTILDGGGKLWVLQIDADNVEISNFTIQNGQTGIFFESADYAVISGNTISNNEVGIAPSDSSGCVLRDNNVTLNKFGIGLDRSSGCVLRDNVMILNRYNFGVYGKYRSNFIHDIDTSNTVDGKPIYYWINQRDRIVPTDAGYVGIIHSFNITVRNLKLANNSQGVLFVGTNNSTIVNVEVTNNVAGIVIRNQSNHNFVDGNRVSNNGRGISLYNSSYNTFSGNSIANNDCGIYLLESSNNTFFHNDFVYNSRSVGTRDMPTHNMWDNGSEGNYWSNYTGLDLDGDGIGDTPCWIIEENQDSCPLMSPLWLVSGDVNIDGIVDVFDVTTAGLAFGSYPAHPRWNVFADMNGDRVVDIFDLILIVKNFGKAA